MTREEEIYNAIKDLGIGAYADDGSLGNDEYSGNDLQSAFTTGVEWADKNPKSPWISVKEKLPYNNPNFTHFGFTNRVLVRDKKGNLFVAYMKKNKDNKWIWCNDIDDNFDLLSDITYWMYIPKL